MRTFTLPHIKVPFKLQDELSDMMRFIDRMPHEVDVMLQSQSRGQNYRWTWVVPSILPWNTRRTPVKNKIVKRRK